MKPSRAASGFSSATGGSRVCRPLPILTVGLLVAGAVTFCTFPEAGRGGTACLPVDDLGMLNLVLLTAAGVFVHPDVGCLLLHLGLLGFYGILMERRWGSGPVLAAVLLGSVLAGLIRLNLLLDPDMVGAPAPLMVTTPAIGFSGVVAGLMGLFVMAGAGTTRTVCQGGRWRRWVRHPVVAIGVVTASLLLMRQFAGVPAPAAALTHSVDGWALLSAFSGGFFVGIVVLALDAEMDADPSQGMAPEHQNPKREAGSLCRYRMA